MASEAEHKGSFRQSMADDQQRMRHHSRRYSNLVKLFKILLPLVALALIGTLVAWPDKTGGNGLKLTFIDSEHDIGKRLGLHNARYIGLDKNNQPFAIAAEKAYQDPRDSNQINLENMQANLAMSPKDKVAIKATSGHYHRTENWIKLYDGVDFSSDSGYLFKAEGVNIDLTEGRMSSTSPVEGKGPMGHLKAGKLAISDNGKKLVFSEGVQLRLEPKDK